MSRSYRHTPKRSYDNGGSEKPCKIIWHQMMRAATRQCLHHADPGEIVLPHEREIFSDWDFGRTNKRWFDPKQYPEWMRK